MEAPSPPQRTRKICYNMRHAKPHSTTAEAGSVEAPSAPKQTEVPVAFGLNSKDDYEYVDVSGIPVEGSVLPVRLDNGESPLVLRAEDPAGLAEALEERLCVLTGDPEGDPGLWDRYADGWTQVYGEDPPNLTLSDRAVLACTDVANLCSATAELGRDQVAMPKIAMYLDSVAFGEKRSAIENRLQSGAGTATFSMSVPEVVNHGGWPGEWAGPGAVLPDVASFVGTLIRSAFDDARPKMPDGSSLIDDYPPATLDARLVKDAFSVLSRADLLLVPCTVSTKGDITFSASGMSDPEEACPCYSDPDGGELPCVPNDCPWETSYTFSIPVRPYDSATASEDFFPFLCWCMCPLWHHTAAWSCKCDYPMYPQDARHDAMESAGGTPTFYFSWAAEEGVCCPTVAGINGSNGTVVVGVSDSVSGLPADSEIVDVVIVYRAWHVAGPEKAINGTAKYVARMYKVSGTLTANVAGAMTAGVARSLLARSGMPPDPAPSKALHSDQVGVDIVGAYAVVKPAFRSDLSEYRDVLE